MADQAPSPATAEGGGQEVVEQDPQAQGGQAEGGSAEDQGAPGEVAPEPKPRQRKERLPGVVARGDGDDIFPDLGYKSKSGKRVSREQAMREVDEEMRAEHGSSPFDIPEPPEGAEKKPEAEAPKTQKIKFGDKEYNSLEEAEQSFRSLQGMFKPMQERLTSAEQLAEKAAESARAWRQRAIELEQGTAPAAAAPTPQRPVPPESGQQERDPRADLEAALANVNGELFESLAREHGLPLAGRYLAAQVLATVNDQMLPRLRQEIMDQLAPELEPLKQDRGFQQATQHVADLITQVSEYKNADGSEAFPELQDEQTVFEIGDLWRSMDMPVEIAMTPKGLLQAIAMYRMYNGSTPRQAASTTASAEVSRPANLAPPTAGQSLEAGTAPSPVRGRNADPAASFGRSLDDAPLVDPILGFSVRRRR